MAFWKREEAVAHGFESVRMTIEQNFEPLREVLGFYGLEMSAEAARRKAEQVSWKTVSDDVDAPPLRLVGS